MRFISHHIMPLVINNLRHGHTHKHAYRQSAQDAGPILKNQVHAGLQAALQVKILEVNAHI